MPGRAGGASNAEQPWNTNTTAKRKRDPLGSIARGRLTFSGVADVPGPGDVEKQNRRCRPGQRIHCGWTEPLCGRGVVAAVGHRGQSKPCQLPRPMKWKRVASTRIIEQPRAVEKCKE